MICHFSKRSLRCHRKKEITITIPKSLSKYIGGKQRLAAQLVQLMPPHERYIEAFAGMASVFLTKPKSPINYVNDLNGNIINLFSVAREQPEALAKLIQLTPYAQDQFNEWSNLYLQHRGEFDKLSSLKRALIFYYILRCAYNSNFREIKKLKTVSYIVAKTWGNEAMLDNIFAFSKFTQGVVLTSLDNRELIDKYADGETLVYLDPPYTMAKGRNYYEYNFGENDHKKLRDYVADTARERGTKFIISYDDSAMIKGLFDTNTGVFWHTIIKDVFQSSSGVNEDGEKATKSELVITTYDTKFLGLFG